MIRLLAVVAMAVVVGVGSVAVFGPHVAIYVVVVAAMVAGIRRGSRTNE